MRVTVARLALLTGIALCSLCGSPVWADSRGDEMAAWINRRGAEEFGPPPPPCDDRTFARRVYLDLLGRVPSLAELQDFEQLGPRRRSELVDQLVFGEGPRARGYQRENADHLANYWHSVLLPTSTATVGNTSPLRSWLRDVISEGVPYNEWMGRLARADTVESTGQYYSLVGSLPENYAGNLVRASMGVRIECAQCHDHPFTAWTQNDFWGMAAFYGDLPRFGDNPNSSTVGRTPGVIEYEGEVYRAKLLDAAQAMDGSARLRGRLADWLTAPQNRNFTATAVNRCWQYLIGQGLYSDVDNLDQASEEDRRFLDEFGDRFAADGFDLRRLLAAICKSDWYQAVSESGEGEFQRPLKALSPEQVFNSLEQSLLLPISSSDPSAPRWTGERLTLVSRLSESTGNQPSEYAAGVPQALLLMNGRLTSDAVDPDRSRLLRAVLESPFLADETTRIDTLYLAVLTRAATPTEHEIVHAYLEAQPPEQRSLAYGEILWTLINSPEFVLCR